MWWVLGRENKNEDCHPGDVRRNQKYVIQYTFKGHLVGKIWCVVDSSSQNEELRPEASPIARRRTGNVRVSILCQCIRHAVACHLTCCFLWWIFWVVTCAAESTSSSYYNNYTRQSILIRKIKKKVIRLSLVIICHRCCLCLYGAECLTICRNHTNEPQCHEWTH